jgi:hypothetical protein
LHVCVGYFWDSGSPFLAGLASNCNYSDHCLLRSSDYRREPGAPSKINCFILMLKKNQWFSLYIHSTMLNKNIFVKFPVLGIAEISKSLWLNLFSTACLSNDFCFLVHFTIYIIQFKR